MASRARVQIRVRGAGAPGPRGGGVYIPAVQRTRLLDAAVAVVAEQGYRRMAVRRVCERAGVSSKTFYDLFADREDCFLAAFDYALDELAVVVLPAYQARDGWRERVRAALHALLAFLDGEPELRTVLLVEALTAGPRVLARRAEVLGELARAIDGGRAGGKSARPPGGLAPLTAEGVVGGVFGVIYARLLQRRPEPLTELLNELMATIVLPYRGRAAAARELARPVPPTRQSGSGHLSRPRDLIVGALDSGQLFTGRGEVRSLRRSASVDFRITQRTYRALAAIAEQCAEGTNPSNREVSAAARISDQGHVSRLMARLREQALVENTAALLPGNRKAWRLTPRGEELLSASCPQGSGRP